MTTGSQIPGFTPEQTWALKQVIKEAVREANDHDERVAKLEVCVFGNGEVGLDERIRQLECFEARVARLTWLVVAQIVVLLGSGVVALVFGIAS